MNSLYALRQIAAEILGAAVVELFPGTVLVDGGATEHGFFYEVIAEQPIDEYAIPLIEEKMRCLIKQNLEVRFIDMMQENAAQYLEHRGQPIKAAEIRKVRDNIVSLCQIGDFCDFIPLVHATHTQDVAAFKILQIEPAMHYLAGKGKVAVKRIHGTAFGDKSALKKYLKVRDAASKCDYRQIAVEMKLFSQVNEISDNALVWDRNGAVLKETLLNWWQSEHGNDGFHQISSPQFVKESLFKKSGYAERPGHVSPTVCRVEGVDYVFNPTLTVAHAAHFGSRLHSYRELPLRYAECGAVIPGTKASRLRGMHNSDLVTADFAHIFCTIEQLEAELISSLQFIDKIIKMFGFECYWRFLAQGRKSAGRGNRLERANQCFSSAFQQCGMPYTAEQQEFSFAGPAADAKLIDSLGREWNGPRIGIDFDLPERLGLRYQGADDEMHVPILVVRTLFGSIERFVGLLLEHCAGRLPLWLAPEQVRVVPVKENNQVWAAKVSDGLNRAGFRVSLNGQHELNLGKRIHSAEDENVPYLVVIGEKEENSGQITLRTCAEEAHQQMMTVEELVLRLHEEASSKAHRNSGRNAKKGV